MFEPGVEAASVRLPSIQHLDLCILHVPLVVPVLTDQDVLWAADVEEETSPQCGLAGVHVSVTFLPVVDS